MKRLWIPMRDVRCVSDVNIDQSKNFEENFVRPVLGNPPQTEHLWYFAHKNKKRGHHASAITLTSTQPDPTILGVYLLEFAAFNDILPGMD